MKRHSKLITITALCVIVISLLASLLLDEQIGNRVSNIITTITAIIGAIALFIQFRKDKELNQANFVMEFGKSFFNEYNCGDLFNELNSHYDEDDGWTLDITKCRKEFTSYMLWIEALSDIIFDGILDIRKVDKILYYRFFIIVNNKEVQRDELIPYKDLYKGTYKLYNLWYNYRKKNNLVVPLEENSLHLVEGFNDNIKNK